MAAEVQGRIIAILARAIGGCWWTFKWTVALAVVVGAVAAVCLYRRVDEEIRRRIETRIARQYPGLKVCVRAAQRIEGRGIQVRDLSIAEPGDAARRAAARRGTAGRMPHRLAAIADRGGRGAAGNDPPANAPGATAARRPMERQATFPPGPRRGSALRGGGRHDRDSRRRPAGRPAAAAARRESDPHAGAGAPFPGAFLLRRATLRRIARRRPGGAQFEGQVDLRTATCALHGRAQNLEISPEAFDTLPAPVATRAAAPGDLRADGDLQFAVAYDPAAIRPVTFDISGRLLRSRLDDARLPHELNDISATVRINNDGLTITDLSARSGQATLRLGCRCGGFEPGSPLRLSAEVGRLELDAALRKVLPPACKPNGTSICPLGRWTPA